MDGADDGLLRIGRRAWAVVGITVVAVILYFTFSAPSGLVIPLAVAAVVGALFVPLVDRLAAFMSRKLAAALVMLSVVVTAVGALSLAISGVIDQAPQIRAQLRAGLETLREWLADVGIDLASAADQVNRAEDLTGGSLPGISTYVGTVFSSASSFVAGSAIGLFILYYVLADWGYLAGWLVRISVCRPTWGTGSWGMQYGRSVGTSCDHRRTDVSPKGTVS